MRSLAVFVNGDEMFCIQHFRQHRIRGNCWTNQDGAGGSCFSSQTRNSACKIQKKMKKTIHIQYYCSLNVLAARNISGRVR